jgi:hypothetical protein
MHLTLKKEATRPAAKNFLQQQARFDRFLHGYNHERPHQALGMKYPAELYGPSPRPYRGLPELHYPLHDRTITVTHCGRVCFGSRKINLSQAFAGQTVGVREVADHVWLISFMHYERRSSLYGYRHFGLARSVEGISGHHVHQRPARPVGTEQHRTRRSHRGHDVALVSHDSRHEGTEQLDDIIARADVTARGVKKQHVSHLDRL